MTDSQSVSLSWCQAPIWDPRPIFLSPCNLLLDSCGVLFCSALSDERTGVSLTVAAGPRQLVATAGTRYMAPARTAQKTSVSLFRNLLLPMKRVNRTVA
jgi:hypothetical protein